MRVPSSFYFLPGLHMIFWESVTAGPWDLPRQRLLERQADVTVNPGRVGCRFAAESAASNKKVVLVRDHGKLHFYTIRPACMVLPAQYSSH